MKDRVERKVVMYAWLPLAHRMQGSHWLTDCGEYRALIGSQNAGFAGLPLVYTVRKVQGSHWLTECGVCRAPIGLHSAESVGLAGSQNAGSVGL